MSAREHVINMCEGDPNWSDPFLAGPMFVRICHRCGALTLDGMTLIHNLWHERNDR